MYIREGTRNAVPSLPQNTASPSIWDPSTISNIIFGIIMVFVGVVAIWQGRQRRVIVLDEELAVITPVRGSTSLLNHTPSTPDLAIQIPASRLMLHDASNVSSSTARLDILDRERSEEDQAPADDHFVTPAISNRLTTLSTIDDRCFLQRTTSEPDMTEAEGNANITDGLDIQDADLETAIQR